MRQRIMLVLIWSTADYNHVIQFYMWHEMFVEIWSLKTVVFIKVNHGMVIQVMNLKPFGVLSFFDYQFLLRAFMVIWSANFIKKNSSLRIRTYTPNKYATFTTTSVGIYFLRKISKITYFYILMLFKQFN